ncbi:MAG: alpha-E domain-containing protein [bacterium]
MSRYMERAESSARILDVNIQLVLDSDDQSANAARDLWSPILSTLSEQELFESRQVELNGDTVMDFVTFDKANPSSILSSVTYARENARTVREQISSEMWEQLNRLYLYLQNQSARAAFRESPIGFYRSLVDRFHSFQGITDATMTHGEGWQFLQAGKYLERADSTSRVLDFKYHVLLPSGERVGGNVDITQWMAVLRSCSAMEAYLKLYHGRVTSWEVAGFLILHDTFPRSIRFCVDALDQALHSISGSERGHFSNEAERLSGMLRSSLDYTTVDSIFQSGLHQYLDQTQARIGEVSMALSQTYCRWL